MYQFSGGLNILFDQASLKYNTHPPMLKFDILLNKKSVGLSY